MLQFYIYRQDTFRYDEVFKRELESSLEQGTIDKTNTYMQICDLLSALARDIFKGNE